MHEVRIEIALQEKKARALAVALGPRKGRRSTVDVKSKDDSLVISVSSLDASAMRAALNSYLRMLDACLKIIDR